MLLISRLDYPVPSNTQDIDVNGLDEWNSNMFRLSKRGSKIQTDDRNWFFMNNLSIQIRRSQSRQARLAVTPIELVNWLNTNFSHVAHRPASPSLDRAQDIFRRIIDCGPQLLF